MVRVVFIKVAMMVVVALLGAVRVRLVIIKLNIVIVYLLFI